MQEFDPPHRHGVLKFPQSKIEQRSRRNNVQFRQQFMEIAQQRQRGRASLNLIEKQQRFARRDAPATQHAKLIQNPFWIGL